jgi:hypothetical protein
MEEPGLACPSCSREFEIPHKSMRADDMEFLPVPRLLSCLHTVCQSCVQEMCERNTSGKVLCPICRKDREIKGVGYLPLDVSILKNILSNSKADVMSFCNRCYDEVPSYSWCQSCSIALCEFHHQDHKLSVDTSKHGLQTFKEIAHQHVHIEPRLPAIICPEIEKQDCTAYCHECKHVVSVHGALQNHSEHNTEDCLHGYNEMRAKVHTALDRSKRAGNELKIANRNVKIRLQELDKEVERATRDIEDEFDMMRKLLNDRETALMTRLKAVSDQKRGILTNQIIEFSEYLDECRLASDIADNLLRDTDDMRENSQDAAYLVGVADTVSDRVQFVEDKLKETDLRPGSDAEVAVSFNLAELSAVQMNIPIIGCVQTAEDIGSMGKDDGIEPEINVHHSKHRLAHKQRVLQTHAPSISFTIKSEPSSTVTNSSKENNNSNINGNGNSSSSKGGVNGKGSRTQSLVIEVRQTESIVEEGVANNTRNHGQGPLLGQVILTTEMDKRLINKNEIRSFFESVVIKNVPIMKITKEFLPNAASFNPNRSPDREDRHERGRLDGRDRSVDRNDREKSFNFNYNGRDDESKGWDEKDRGRDRERDVDSRYDPIITTINTHNDPDPLGPDDKHRHNDYQKFAHAPTDHHRQKKKYEREPIYGGMN